MSIDLQLVDEGEGDEDKPSAPLWMATFADLMSLLVCFFVLIISMSEIDVIRYKKVAGSMKDAFGVQQDIVTYDIPKGTSIIALEFSPGKPEPTIRKSSSRIQSTRANPHCESATPITRLMCSPRRC